MTLAEKVIAYRERHIISQGEMAKLCGLDRSTITKIELGNYKYSQITEWKINKVIKEDDNGRTDNE